MESVNISRTYRRFLFFIAAFILLIFFIYGKNQWEASGHSLSDSWEAATQTDWLLTITFFDAGIFTVICLLWMLFDLKEQRINRLLKIALFVLTVIFGAVGFLVYLGIRNRRRLLSDHPL